MVWYGMVYISEILKFFIQKLLLNNLNLAKESLRQALLTLVSVFHAAGLESRKCGHFGKEKDLDILILLWFIRTKYEICLTHRNISTSFFI